MFASQSYSVSFIFEGFLTAAFSWSVNPFPPKKKKAWTQIYLAFSEEIADLIPKAIPLSQGCF